ncbi:MAG: hypothetical protein ACNA7O_15525 [Rhodobacterales bacterium]
MTNQIAIGLGLLLIAGIGLDAALYDGTNLLFLLRKLDDLVEWLAFWR